MFLNQLSYQEKKMFLNLSVYVAKANGELSLEEKTLINRYCKETNMPAVVFLESEPVDKIIDFFSGTEDKVKRIIMLELLGLVYADGTYDQHEYSFMKNLASKVGVDDDLYNSIEKAIVNYYSASMSLAECIE